MSRYTHAKTVTLFVMSPYETLEVVLILVCEFCESGHVFKPFLKMLCFPANEAVKFLVTF